MKACGWATVCPNGRLGSSVKGGGGRHLRLNLVPQKGLALKACLNQNYLKAAVLASSTLWFALNKVGEIFF